MVLWFGSPRRLTRTHSRKNPRRNLFRPLGELRIGGRDSSLTVRTMASAASEHSNPSSTNASDRPASEVRRTARALVLASAIVMLFALAPVAAGLAGAVALYEICRKPYIALTRRMSQRLAAAVIVCAVLLLIALPFLWLGFRLSARIPAVVSAIKSLSTSPAGGILARPELEQIIAKARDGVANVLPSALGALSGSAAWALLNWSIAAIGLYYLLLSASAIWRWLCQILPFSPAGNERLRVKLQDTSLAIVAGTLLSAAVQGASIGLGFFLAGTSDALFWAACGAVTTLVPLVGNALVWLPALVYMLVTGRFEGALFIGIFGGLGPPVIDRVVRSAVSSRIGSVHPMITLVGGIAGIRVAGVAGLILGPVALDMFVALVEVYSREYLRLGDAEKNTVERSSGDPRS